MCAATATLPSMLRDGPRPRLELVADEAPEPPSRPDREARALAELAEGNVEALGVLYDLHDDAVRAFSRRFLGDPTAAEDLVHDVFLALPDAAPRLRGSSSIRNYLIGIAVNLSRHHLRSARRKREALARLAHEPIADGGTPEQALARERLAAALQRALDALSHEHRATFVLCEVEERSGPDVAAILGIPEATVRTRLFHAKRKLRETLEGER